MIKIKRAIPLILNLTENSNVFTEGVNSQQSRILFLTPPNMRPFPSTFEFGVSGIFFFLGGGGLLEEQNFFNLCEGSIYIHNDFVNECSSLK